MDSQTTDSSGSEITVDLLWFAGCPNQLEAEKLLLEIANLLGAEITIERTRIDDQDLAQELKFAGSPTIRVAGRDIEPGFQEPEDGMLGCRVYESPDGLAGVPAAEWIRAALASEMESSMPSRDSS